jgi:hypothetical protein
MSDQPETASFRTIAEQRDATLASIATGAAMMGAALHQLEEIDWRLGMTAPEVRDKLSEDWNRVTHFVAEHISRFMPDERVARPKEGIRPLQARVADADDLEKIIKEKQAPRGRSSHRW